MIQGYEMLYLGTAAMLFLSLSLLVFVVWATNMFQKQKQHQEQRDKHWMERIEGVEALVRNEFKAVLDHLKKL